MEIKLPVGGTAALARVKYDPHIYQEVHTFNRVDLERFPSSKEDDLIINF